VGKGHSTTRSGAGANEERVDVKSKGVARTGGSAGRASLLRGRGRRRDGNQEATRLRRLLLVGPFLLALLPVPPVLAQTGVTCIHDTYETVDPGLTTEVHVHHHNGAGTWTCNGAILRRPIVSVPGPMEFLIWTEGTCLSERGVGSAKARIPLERHDFALLRFKFVYTREATAIHIRVTDGTAEVGGEKEDLLWHGVLHVTPTRGDCITEPVSAARVIGELAGVGT
jgi:hypothetical protein